MKKFSNILIAGVLATFSLTSCERDLTSLNEDPKHPSVLQSKSLLATGQYQSSYYMHTGSVNFNNYRFFVQQWAETTYIDETNYDLVTRNQPRNNWNRMYVYSLNNFEQAKKNLATESNTPAMQNNKWATLEISQLFVWENIVDTYGDVPYFNALNADEGQFAPKYDDAKTIYTDLLKRLDAAIAKIDVSSSGYGDGDLIYAGDMTKWKHFANSVKLRLALNLADVDPTVSKAAAESAIASGVLASENESYTFIFDKGTFTNPIYDDLVASGRNDFVPTILAVTTMDATNDPRRHAYFAENLSNALVEDEVTTSSLQTITVDEVPTVSVGKRVYSYIPGGENAEEAKFYYGKVTAISGNDITIQLNDPNVKPDKNSYVGFEYYKGGTFGSKNPFGSRTHMNFYAKAKNAPAVLLGYTEVLFMKAEAAARGYNAGGSVSDFYNAALKASLKENGVLEAEANTYVLANPFDATNWKKSIGTQAWVSLFNKPFAAWNFSRRLDYPTFVNPPNSKIEGVPVRMPYSDQEYVLNGTNVRAAASKIGGDKAVTKLFWDIH